jgi:hypothetical protein
MSMLMDWIIKLRIDYIFLALLAGCLLFFFGWYSIIMWKQFISLKGKGTLNKRFELLFVWGIFLFITLFISMIIIGYFRYALTNSL